MAACGPRRLRVSEAVTPTAGNAFANTYRQGDPFSAVFNDDVRARVLQSCADARTTGACGVRNLSRLIATEDSD